MIKPKRISPKRLAGSRYLGTKRFIFSSPRHLPVCAFALNRDDQHKRSIPIGPKSYGRPRMYLGIYSWQNSKQDLCATRNASRKWLITNFNPQKSCLLNRQKHPSPHPVIPSACLAPARLAVIAGRTWLMPAKLLSPNLPPTLRLRKRSPQWKLCLRRLVPWRLSALIRGRR